MNKKASSGLCLFFLMGSAWSYDERTHEVLSAHTAQRSILARNYPGNPDLLNSLGLESYEAHQKFPDSTGFPRTIEELISFGARHEDRLIPDFRSVHHFYDPLKDRPLTIGGASLGNKSPDWALEDGGDVPFPIQNFSYKDAQQYFVWALSLVTPEERERYWGLLFQTLGHVIHHIQDMAQPQHVRNDAHLPLPIVGDASWYERYTRENPEKIRPHFSPFSIYIQKPRELWHHPQGHGLADFTNRNFVSKDTNFKLRNNAAVPADYPLPVPGYSHSQSLELLGVPGAKELCNRLKNDSRLVLPPGASCNIEFITSTIQDRRSQHQWTNPSASSLSVFDQYLRDVNGTVVLGGEKEGSKVIVDRLFTLNRFNFDWNYLNLIPRATQYSTGLLDHFFRVRLALRRPAQVFGSSVEVVVRQDSSHNITNGTISLFYDLPSGRRKRLNIRSGKSPDGFRTFGYHTIVADLPQDFDFGTNNELTLLLETTTNGNEPAVAGLVFPFRNPSTGFIVSPSFVPKDGIHGDRHISQKDGVWQLYSEDGGFESGNVDWKGRYVGERPTRVLSWFAAGNAQWIYQYGKRFAVAPGRVLGVAIASDSSGKEWLIAICNDADGAGDFIYKRPNTFSLSANLFDPVSAPEGWKLIEQLDPFPNLVTTHPLGVAWYFNGSGTQAQTMRNTTPSHFSKGRTRLRLDIDMESDTARLTDLGNELVKTETRLEVVVDCSTDPNGRPYATAEHNHSQYKSTGGCVNYLDNREILARVRFERSHTGRSSYFPYGENNGFSTDIRHAVLQIDDLQIPILDYERELRNSYSSGRSSSRNFERVDSATIGSMDLRSGVVTLRRDAQMEEALASGYVEGFTTVIDATSNTTKGPMVVEWKDKKTSHSVYASSAISSSRSGRSNGGYPPTSHSSSRGCGRTVLFNGSSEHVLRLNGGYPQHLGDLHIGLGISGSTAADRDGNLFVSIQYVDEKSNTKTYDYLTDGDLGELFGVTGPRFYHYASPN